MKERPLLSFTVCWVIGSALACHLSGLPLGMAWIGSLLLLAVLGIWGTWSLKYIAVLGLAFTLAGLYWEWNEGRNVSALPEVLMLDSPQLEGSSVQAEGTIISEVRRDGDRVDFTMRINKLSSGDSDETNRTNGKGERVIVQVKLEVEEEITAAASWHRGDDVNLSGVLERPAEARNFGGFDYRAYLLSKQVHWLLKITGSDHVKAAAPATWNLSTILRWIDGVRNAIGAEIDRLFQERHSGYMKGLIIGMRGDLDPDTFMQFSQLGLTHILAISGMHVAVYVGTLLFILLRLRVTRETAQLVVLFLVPVYVLLSGAGPSVVRAGIMIMIGLVAARRGVLKDGLNILGGTALLMLIWNPYFLLSVSFQLSFLVTAGLMVYTPLAAPLLSRLPEWLKNTLAVTLVAQFVSFPLTIYYFNQFSLLSFAANFVVVPLITLFVLPLGMVTLLLGRAWGGAANTLGAAVEWLNNATFYAVEWMNGWSGGITIWRSPSLYWIAAYYLILYGLLYMSKKLIGVPSAPQYMEDDTVPLEGLNPYGRSRRGIDAYPLGRTPRWGRTGLTLLAVGFGLLLYRGYQSDTSRGTGAISFLDIGQGDSILITTPGGSNILVDGGGTVSFGKKEEWRLRRSPFEVGAKVLLPLLKKRGIHRLDAVILTHGDQDHAGGLQAVLEGIPVSALLFNGTIADREPYLKLMQTALDREVKLYGVHQGMIVSPDKDTELAFLWPKSKEEGWDKLQILEEQNHDSVVFRLRMNGRSFLFTGDMDLEAEEIIVETGLKNGISQGARIDVIKAAHHGSKTSTGEPWLEYWNPSIAVISVGVNNSYGHPNGQVLERLSARNIQILRTDQQGEIQMRVLRKGTLMMRHKLE